MAKPNFIELPGCEPIQILFEDRSVIAIDKPRGWMLVPDSWRKTNWNLQTAIDSSIRADDFWARSRNLRYLRHVHRLDADTSGVMLFAKSEGAMRAMGEMFESRRMEKTYLAVVEGVPREKEWICELPLGPDPKNFGKMRVDNTEEGKECGNAFSRAGEQRAFHVDRGESADGTHASNSRASGGVGQSDHVRRTLRPRGKRFSPRPARGAAGLQGHVHAPAGEHPRAGGKFSEGIWFQADTGTGKGKMGATPVRAQRKERGFTADP